MDYVTFTNYLHLLLVIIGNFITLTYSGEHFSYHSSRYPRLILVPPVIVNSP